MLDRLVIAAGGPSRGPELAVAADVGVEFPTVTLVCNGPSVADERCVTVDLVAWAAPFADTGALDRRIEAADARGPFGLRLVGVGAGAGAGTSAGGARACLEILTRYQRFVGRRNRASKGPLFDRVLARHRALHDLAQPLARSDFDGALDVWQWLLRLDPDAGLAAQAAALFHDVEQVEAEAWARFERRTSTCEVFKDESARHGAAIARAILAGAGVGAAVLDRVATLVEGHQASSDDPESALLEEACALSFLSRDSAGYVDRHGPELGRARVARALGRLGPRGRPRVRSIRCRPDVRALVLLERGGATSQPVA